MAVNNLLASAHIDQNKENEIGDGANYAVIQWVTKNAKKPQYSTVHLKDFVDDTRNLKIDEIYRVKYGNIKYRAKLCLQGTKQACDKLIDSYCEYQVDEQHQANISKQPKRKIDSITKDKDDLEIKTLREENTILQRKFNDQAAQLNHLELELEEKKQKITELERRLDDIVADNRRDYCKRDQLIEVANFIYNTIGNTDDLKHLACAAPNVESDDDNRMSIISTRYPQHKIQYILKRNIEAMSKDAKRTDTFLYRQLVKRLIPDDNVWADGNAESIKTNHPILRACFDYINELRPTFAEKAAQSTLTQICCEARRERKTTTQQPASTQAASTSQASPSQVPPSQVPPSQTPLSQIQVPNLLEQLSNSTNQEAQTSYPVLHYLNEDQDTRDFF